MALCLLTLSACSTAPIKTETVTVYKPSYVKLPAELTEQVPEPGGDIRTNRDLSDLALALRSALRKANAQLKAIDDLQP